MTEVSKPVTKCTKHRFFNCTCVDLACVYHYSLCAFSFLLSIILCEHTHFGDVESQRTVEVEPWHFGGDVLASVLSHSLRQRYKVRMQELVLMYKEQKINK